MRILAVVLYLFAWPLWAATPLSLQHLPIQTLKQTFALDTQPTLKQTFTPNQLRFVKTHQSLNHMYHTRLQQYYHNLPVFGGYTIIHSRAPYQETLKANSSMHLTGQLFKNLEQDLSPMPELDKNASHVLDQFKQNYAHQHIINAKISPLVYIDTNHQAHWAYKINLIVINENNLPAAPSAIIDAQTLTPYLKWNDLKTHTKVKGLGYGGNPIMGSYQYGQDRDYLTIQQVDDKICNMENDHARVIDMKHSVSDNFTKTMVFPCSTPLNSSSLQFWTGYAQDGYDKTNEANSPSNDALFFAEMIYGLYHDWFNLSPLVSRSGKPLTLIMRVHYGKNFANAYWDGEQMTFGDGDKNTFYPLVSLGISAHEISHGFTEQHADLFYYGQSGAINEAFSDMADKAAEYYANYPTDWRIGWEIFKPQSHIHALRYMDLPSKDGDSVDTLQAYLTADKDSYSEYGEGLDVHYGSGVFNRLFYLLATSNAWDIRKAFEVMVYANMDYWTPLSDFQNAACGVLSATKDLGYAIEDVSNAITQVGLDPKSCK